MADAGTDTAVASLAEPFIGRILDGDGHMYMDAQTLREVAGELDGGHMVEFIQPGRWGWTCGPNSRRGPPAAASTRPICSTCRPG